jgi:hypothetical protein
LTVWKAASSAVKMHACPENPVDEKENPNRQDLYRKVANG